MKCVFLDTETTGTDPVKNGIIQLSGIISIPRGGDVGWIDEPFDLKMQPFPADVIEDKALLVTGTTREELATRMLCFDGYKAFCKVLGHHIEKFNKTDKALGIEVDDTRLHDALYDIGIYRQIYNVCTGEAP
jgi:DNA polymerase III epsilon subunit-like protein